MSDDLKAKLEALGKQAAVYGPIGGYVAGGLAIDAARLALESMPCMFGSTDVTCITEKTPRVRRCLRCRRLTELDK